MRGTKGFSQSRNSLAPGSGFKSLTTSIMSSEDSPISCLLWTAHQHVPTDLTQVLDWSTPWMSEPWNQLTSKAHCLRTCFAQRLGFLSTATASCKPSYADLDIVLAQQVYSVSHELVIVWLVSSCSFQAFNASLLLELQPSLPDFKCTTLGQQGCTAKPQSRKLPVP